MRDDALLKDLVGVPPYYRYHPRIRQHGGWAVVAGCLNWEPYSQELASIGVRVCGVDPQNTIPLPGARAIHAALAPFRGRIKLYGEGGGASLLWFHCPQIADVPAITIEDVMADLGVKDLAALYMNAEGAEGFVLLAMKAPYADQMTIAFHDRPGLDPFIPSARDGLLIHLGQWYDYCQIEASQDWWFFLRRAQT